MKKLIGLLLVSLVVFTSCLDVYQHLSKNKNGNTDMYLQLNFSKALIAMVNGASQSQEDFDFDDFLDNNVMISTFNDSNIPILEQGKIDSETDFGFYIKASYDSSKQKGFTESTSFFPQKIGNTTVIHLDFESSSENDSEINQMTNAILNSAKYRLSISKSYISKINKVSLEDDEIIRKIHFIDMNDTFLIEIPIFYILNKKTKLIIE